jgi:hypothetical protein
MLFFFHSLAALGTSVDRISICNLEGYPGDTVQAKITLMGTDAAYRSGFWDKYYKKTDGDTERMDIRSWITFDPQEYTITQDESKIFIIKVKIPDNASPGLWGAATAEAGLTGHSDERRTYILFKDAFEDGNLYSGMLIPVSVQVLGRANPLAGVFNVLRENALVSVLAAIIALLIVILLTRKRYRKIV